MKKLALIILTVSISLLTTAGSVLAVGGPHGSYAYNIDGCATCHSTHTSSYDKLMKTGFTETQVCYQCHNGSGSSMNVEQGQISTTLSNVVPAPAGAFELNAAPKTVTSAHMVGNTYASVPGGYDNTNALLVNYNFQCGSCHNPHGSINPRLLRDTINGYAVNYQEVFSNATFTDKVSGLVRTDGIGASYISGTSSLCSACHRGYYNNTSSTGPNIDPVTGSTTYSHRVDFDPSPYAGAPTVNYNPAGTTTSPYMPGEYTAQVPLETNAPAGPAKVSCMTCHYAHGTRVAAPDPAVFQSKATGTLQPSSSLLRNPKREVCNECHSDSVFY